MVSLPLFVLIGDPFLCEEKRKEIISGLEKEFGAGFPVTVRRAGDVPVASLLSEARTLPFLAQAQALCVRDAARFTKGDLELWSEYFKTPHPRTFFIFEADSLEKGHPLLERGAQAKQVFWLESQTERIVAQFIRQKLRQAGKKIAPEAQDLLEERIGEAWTFLDSLLEQLILLAGDRAEISRSDVEALDEKLSQWEGEDLLQALGGRNVAQAVAVLNDLLEMNFRDFPAVIGLIHWQLRRFWEAKRWLSQGVSEREVASRLRLSPARTPGFFKQLGPFSLKGLERILEGLFELDWRLKTGRAEGRYEIETWLVSAISGSPD